ncbi:hypothetical protein [Falsochrobactrum ovis]|uniref:hypothetical protein n=1 Tax=Falsochrobactrum ovis TaxID=1293442 RepID=UPI001FE1A79F|nr:hypothetical protein [Falsochrobactrum ovis]
MFNILTRQNFVIQLLLKTLSSASLHCDIVPSLLQFASEQIEFDIKLFVFGLRIGQLIMGPLHFISQLRQLRLSLIDLRLKKLGLL